VKKCSNKSILAGQDTRWDGTGTEKKVAEVEQGFAANDATKEEVRHRIVEQMSVSIPECACHRGCIEEASMRLARRGAERTTTDAGHSPDRIGR